MKFGDFAFDGRGPHGGVRIGIERKRLSDFINSMRSKRLMGHQLPGMLETYDYTWIIIEGLFRGNLTTGLTESPKGRRWQTYTLAKQAVMYRELDNFMTSIEVQTPARTKVCPTAEATVLAIMDLCQWWRKPWINHRSCKVIYDPFPARVLMTKPTLTRKMANQIPGVGWERSLGVDACFKSPVEMTIATAEEWAQLPGIGATLSKRIVEALNGGKQ